MADSSANYIEETGVEGQGASSSTNVNVQRNNHLFFSKLCDTRKAVLIVNTINVLFIIISAIVSAVVHHQFHLGGLFGGLFGIFLSVIGLYGAIHFDMKASGVAAVGFALCFLMDFIRLNLIAVVIDALLVYPNAYFTWEVYRGIMSKETYKKDAEYLMPGIPDLPEV